MKIIYVAAAVLQRDDGRVLVVQRPEGKELAHFWEHPGGKIEPSETPEQSLQRELVEELNLFIDLQSATPLTFKSFTYNNTHVVLMFYHVKKWHGEIRLLEGQPSYRWILPTEAATLMMPPANQGVMDLI